AATIRTTANGPTLPIPMPTKPTSIGNAGSAAPAPSLGIPTAILAGTNTTTTTPASLQSASPPFSAAHESQRRSPIPPPSRLHRHQKSLHRSRDHRHHPSPGRISERPYHVRRRQHRQRTGPPRHHPRPQGHALFLRQPEQTRTQARAPLHRGTRSARFRRHRQSRRHSRAGEELLRLHPFRRHALRRHRTRHPRPHLPGHGRNVRAPRPRVVLRRTHPHRPHRRRQSHRSHLRRYDRAAPVGVGRAVAAVPPKLFPFPGERTEARSRAFDIGKLPSHQKTFLSANTGKYPFHPFPTL